MKNHYEKTATLSEWPRLLLGFTVVFGLFHGLADALNSDRGQAGVLVGVVVVAATITFERVRYGASFPASVRSLGLGPPHAAGLIASGTVCLILLLIVPFSTWLAGASFAFIPGWSFLLPGLMSQAGIAEEVLFRGYLFRHLRDGRSFWRAAFVSMLPFVSVHLILLGNMSLPIALAAIGLSVVMSFPLAHLFEIGGKTIWAPALLHFVVQGTVKVVAVTSPYDSTFPLVWMAASAVVPWLTLVMRRPRRES